MEYETAWPSGQKVDLFSSFFSVATSSLVAEKRW